MIYKWIIEVKDETIIETPIVGQWLTAQYQNGQLCVWATHRNGLKERWCLRVVGTGHPFTDMDECHYIGTVQRPPLVWHVFAKRVK